MRKIFLHLGVPKTASTSLQSSIFQDMDGAGDLHYLGKREQGNNWLFLDIVHSINAASSSEFASEIISMRKKLARYMREIDQNILISDESFAIPSFTAFGVILVEEKLRRLSVLLEGYEVEILLWIRNQKSALFSLYVELYKSLEILGISSFKQFIEEGYYNDSYDYKKLIGYVNQYFDKPGMHIFSFELLLEEQKDELMKLLKLLDSSISQPQLTNENAKRKSMRFVKANPLTVKRSVELLMIRRFPIVYKIIHKGIFGVFISSVWKKVGGFLNFPVNKGEEIAFPDQSQVTGIAEYYAKGNTELAAEFSELRLSMTRYDYPRI